MARAMDEQSVAQRVLDHIAAGTTDLGTEVWREPVEHYRSPQRLAAEVERVFHRTPTPFCPSAALPEKGSYVARDAAGTPILAIRGADGTVRAFRNACRHRGMQLAAGTGCAQALVCRYHGWTYALDGRLDYVPHEQGFPGLDKHRHGLVPVAATERLGLVFITQREPAAADDPPSALPTLLAPEVRLFASEESEIEANWKLLLEGFLEGYHIRTTHPKTFLPYGFDNLNLIDFFGRNSRVTYPFQRIRKLAEVAPAERRVAGQLTYVYHLFPNALVTVFSRHSKLLILEPLAAGRTRMVSHALAHEGSAEGMSEAKRDAEFVATTGLAEDRAVVCAIERGLASGANEAFTYGLFESAIVHFHRTLDAALAGRS
jgi:phenylpropionate dioxygenase-like ring-hydroxylating dioxygenase large terminal subunit